MASDQSNHMVQMSLLGNNTENVRERGKRNVHIDEDEKQSADLQSNNTCRFTGFLNVTDPCLWETWIRNETSFQSRITNVYQMSPSLHYYFIAATVEYNSVEDNRSAIIQLDFSHPSEPRKYPISIELVAGILRQDMYDLDMSACQNSSILMDPFQVHLLSD
ncbi:uncharacterized protein LOC135051030 isoform X2 [Pseudophryne corroboree]|uniref:uncharacterized protein LOC135051030 isoform X2 n=1 Tax=Pseudophryne corroboree TaxID=495146 RepID=UPI003081B5B1